MAEIGQSSGGRAAGPRQGAKMKRKPAAQDDLPHLKSNQHRAAPGRAYPSVGLRGASWRPVAPAWGSGITAAAPTCSKHLTTSSAGRIKGVTNTHTHTHAHTHTRTHTQIAAQVRSELQSRRGQQPLLAHSEQVWTSTERLQERVTNERELMTAGTQICPP